MPVIQFDYAYMSSVNQKGEQVRMRTILDTSTGYRTACVIDVKGGGDKCVISSAVSFFKELGYTRFRCRTDPEPAIKAMAAAVIKCLLDDGAVEQMLPEETIPESHASLGALEGEDRLGSIVGVTAAACETRHLAAEQISAQTGWCDRVRTFERSVIQETIDAIW